MSFHIQTPSVVCILFVNPSLYDPWHGGGVLTNISDSVVALIIPNGGKQKDKNRQTRQKVIITYGSVVRTHAQRCVFAHAHGRAHVRTYLLVCAYL